MLPSAKTHPPHRRDMGLFTYTGWEYSPSLSTHGGLNEWLGISRGLFFYSVVSCVTRLRPGRCLECPKRTRQEEQCYPNWGMQPNRSVIAKPVPSALERGDLGWSRAKLLTLRHVINGSTKPLATQRPVAR